MQSQELVKGPPTSRAVASFMSWGCSWPSEARPAPIVQLERRVQRKAEVVYIAGEWGLPFLSILDAWRTLQKLQIKAFQTRLYKS